MSFLPGIGGVAGLAGIVAAPFTGGTSLIGTAAAMGSSKLAIDAKNKNKKTAKKNQEEAIAQATMAQSEYENSLVSWFDFQTLKSKLLYVGIGLITVLGVTYFVKRK
jgi:hypothetical protein